MQFRNSRGVSATQLLVSGLALSNTALAVPIEDSPRQYLLAGLELPEKYNKPVAKPPYVPGFRDPLDKAVDTIGKELDPLPYRNGLGASVLGPWNSARSRQSPDLVRPPSTDHGNMKNLRWSFADSHMRIEVSTETMVSIKSDSNLVSCRKAVGPDKQRSVSLAPVSSSPAST
jgi:hypothetical protein